MQQYLITAKEVPVLSRDMSAHIDDARLEVYIRESENIDLKSALGDGLYLDIKQNPDKYTTLLEGGEYEFCNEKKVFAGLKVALAYYTYARFVKNGDGHVARFGYTNKDSEYSTLADIKQKSQAYNEAYSIANTYMKECVQFLTDNRKDYPLYKGSGGIKANMTTFKVIGD